MGVPSRDIYIASHIEHDDRTREIIKLAGVNGLHLLEGRSFRNGSYCAQLESSGRRFACATL